MHFARRNRSIATLGAMFADVAVDEPVSQIVGAVRSGAAASPGLAAITGSYDPFPGLSRRYRRGLEGDGNPAMGLGNRPNI